ncbi:hypothetical protein DAEQUDRAFT_648157, partial [Daedalea quercina L-15889]
DANSPAAEPSTPPSTPPIRPVPDSPPPAPRPVRVRRPMQKVADILAGESGDTRVPRGVQAPTEDASKDEPELVETIHGAAMAAHIAETEGLDPRSLEEAKRRPEWLRWWEAMQEELRAL